MFGDYRLFPNNIDLYFGPCKIENHLSRSFHSGDSRCAIDPLYFPQRTRETALDSINDATSSGFVTSISPCRLRHKTATTVRRALQKPRFSLWPSGGVDARAPGGSRRA